MSVTVVIANYNYGRFLPEAVDSALNQEGGRPRVIVVDDGSTESATDAVLAALPDGVEVVRQTNAGPAAARNAGLAVATTPYVLALDADDRLAPGALATLRAELDADPALGFAYGRMRMFGALDGVLSFPPYSAYTLLYRHTIGLSALLRREVVRDTGGFDPRFHAFEDWELYVDALEHGWRGRQVDAVTLEYRRHAQSKQIVDRQRYREAYRLMRTVHAPLYARAGELAAEDAVSRLSQLAHRAWWGPRPLPARVETALYRLVFLPRHGPPPT